VEPTERIHLIITTLSNLTNSITGSLQNSKSVNFNRRLLILDFKSGLSPLNRDVSGHRNRKLGKMWMMF
jgi:hypothetical protein